MLYIQHKKNRVDSGLKEEGSLSILDIRSHREEKGVILDRAWDQVYAHKVCVRVCLLKELCTKDSWRFYSWRRTLPSDKLLLSQWNHSSAKPLKCFYPGQRNHSRQPACQVPGTMALWGRSVQPAVGAKPLHLTVGLSDFRDKPIM